MVVVGPLPLVVSLIVVAFCDVGRNDVRLVSGFQSEYRSGHVPRRHGTFFLAGILLNSRIHALYTVWGALLPLGMVWMVGSDYAAFNAGLFGYNAVLCAIALGDRSWAGAAWATLSVVISVLLQVWGMSLGMTTLTAPFVVSVWIVLGMRRALCRG